MCSEEEIVHAALSVLTTADEAQAMQLERWGRELQLPPDIAVVHRYGPMPERPKRFAESMIDQLEAPVFFVGDLDPTDLVTYATLVSGKAVGSRLSQTSYLGVGDECSIFVKMTRPDFHCPNVVSR